MGDPMDEVFSTINGVQNTVDGAKADAQAAVEAGAKSALQDVTGLSPSDTTATGEGTQQGLPAEAQAAAAKLQELDAARQDMDAQLSEATLLCQDKQVELAALLRTD